MRKLERKQISDHLVMLFNSSYYVTLFQKTVMQYIIYLGYYTFSSQSASPAEQFHIFACLSMEAAQLAGINDASIPLEDDDPNSTITIILDAARQLGIPVDFSPNKLKQGLICYFVYRTYPYTYFTLIVFRIWGVCNLCSG